MPGKLDGKRLVQQVSKLRPDLKIVVLSGFLDATRADEFNHKNVVMLNKPYKKATLARTLSLLLAGAGEAE